MKNMTKKVLVWGMTSNWGGIESVLFNYVTHADNSSLRFDFITTFNKIPREEKLISLGCNVVHITDRRNNFFAYKRQLNQFMKTYSFKYDAIWLNDCMFANIDILKLAKKYGIQMRVVHAHNAKNLGGGWFRLIRHKINILLLPLYATNYWACSDLAGQWTYSYNIRQSSKYHIINNAIDCQMYRYNNEQRKKCRDEFKISRETFVVGHIGRFDYQKNHGYILAIFQEIAKICSDSKLVLVGVGEDWNKIKKQVDGLEIRDKILLLGQRDDVSYILQMFDVFILPSRFEGLPVVIVEALASGLQCYVSDKVTKEAAVLPEFMHYLSIDDSPEIWANKIIGHKEQMIRQDTYTKMCNANYDINTEANKLSAIFGS